MKSVFRPIILLFIASIGFFAGCASPSLNQAIQFNQSVAARKLIAAGRSINEKDKLGNTPLHYAAQNADNDLVAALLTAGAGVNAQNNEGETPLFFLLRQEGMYPETVALLLEHGADPNRANKSGQSPLQHAADRICYSLDYAAKAKVIRLMVEHGGNVNQTDAAGLTTLHYAASNRPTTILAVVADHANDLTVSTTSGFNAYTVAVIHGQRENAGLLAQKGLKPQLIVSTTTTPSKTPPHAWEVNPATRINALAHDWYAAWLLEQSTPDTTAASRAFATAESQYALAMAEYYRARKECAAEIPRAKSHLAAQKAKAAVRNFLGTAVGLGLGMSTGTGFVVYSVGGFSSQPEYLQWQLGQYDQEIIRLKARQTTLQNPALISSRELWSGKHPTVSHDKWHEVTCIIAGYKVTLDGKPLTGRTVRDQEIKQAVDEFAGQLIAAGIFADVRPAEESSPADQVTLAFTLTEKQDFHAGARAGKAFAVGFFTLGLFGNFTSGAYTYDTSITVQLTGGGLPPAMISSSTTLTSEYSQNTAGAGEKAGKDTRAQATHKVFDSLVAQLARAAGSLEPISAALTH